jgi:hypothetical protein
VLHSAVSKKTQRKPNADAVDAGEQNALWLKVDPPRRSGEACWTLWAPHTAQVGTVGRGSQDRGDYFYKTGNYKAAINAYTASLQVGAAALSRSFRRRAEPSRATLHSHLRLRVRH